LPTYSFTHHRRDPSLTCSAPRNHAPPSRSKDFFNSLGKDLPKLMPDFDSRNYGFRKLSDLMEKLPSFKLVREKNHAGAQVVYVERK
jgi:hypothetical protein